MIFWGKEETHIRFVSLFKSGQCTSLVCIEDLYRHEAKNIHQGGFN